MYSTCNKFFFIHYRIHAQGNAARMKNHPDGRAIFFDSSIYSKRKINDFISALNGYEELLKIIALFKGINTNFSHNFL